MGVEQETEWRGEIRAGRLPPWTGLRRPRPWPRFFAGTRWMRAGLAATLPASAQSPGVLTPIPALFPVPHAVFQPQSVILDVARVTDGPYISRGGRTSVPRATERLLDSSRAICKMHAEPGHLPGPGRSAEEGSRSEMLLSGGTPAGNGGCSPPGPCDGRTLRGLVSGVWEGGGELGGSQEVSVGPWSHGAPVPPLG